MVENKIKKNRSFTVIDGTDLILGRLASAVAKRILLGENIKVINCKNVVIIGRKKFLVDRFKTKISNKVIKQGPYFHRAPADIVKRAMRNMVPYKNARGADALKRLSCFNSVPKVLESEKAQSDATSKLDKDNVLYFTRVEEISRGVGFDKNI